MNEIIYFQFYLAENSRPVPSAAIFSGASSVATSASVSAASFRKYLALALARVEF